MLSLPGAATPKWPVVASATAGSNGVLSFSELGAGSYQVRYTVSAGHALSYSGAADLLSGLTAPVALTPGGTQSVATETLL
jgi:hypothetical protein